MEDAVVYISVSLHKEFIGPSFREFNNGMNLQQIVIIIGLLFTIYQSMYFAELSCGHLKSSTLFSSKFWIVLTQNIEYYLNAYFNTQLL